MECFAVFRRNAHQWKMENCTNEQPKNWCHQPESNRRPRPYQGRATTNCATAATLCVFKFEKMELSSFFKKLLNFYFPCYQVDYYFLFAIFFYLWH